MGRIAAILFAREGAKVVVADVAVKDGEQTARIAKEADGEATFVKVDVSKAESVKNMVRAAVDGYGRLDVLYNNAAVQGDTTYTVDLTEEIYDKHMNVNLKGVWLCMKYAIPEMLKTGGGSIINVASICALVGMRGHPHYSATKGGIVSLSRVTAVEYATKNVRVNCICPGPIQTAIQAIHEKTNPQLYKLWKASIPMGRLGKPEEVAQLALFLASDESSYITGSVVTIDGGLTASSLIQVM
jgi:NAD(P)-dependent dehydrogenase (short-subunit alcohol dehydrogenase family)